MNEKIKKLEKRKGQLEAQIMAKEARDNNTERKKDTRRKILIGAFFLDQYQKQGKIENLVKSLEPYLVRKKDRELFGLPPLEENTNKQ